MIIAYFTSRVLSDNYNNQTVFIFAFNPCELNRACVISKEHDKSEKVIIITTISISDLLFKLQN